MATEFPDTQFIGVDIAPMQPVDCLPSNCQFEAADLMNGLPYQDYRFDYVHQRMLSLAVPKGRWENALREHARVCRPGGWFELIETDWLPRDGGDAAKRLSKYIQQLYEVRGCDPTEITNLEPMMKEVGFEDVRRLMVQLPLGEWGGSIGIEAGQVVLGAWEGMRGQLVGHGIASCEELDEVFAQLEDELVKRPMWVCLAVYIGQRGAN
jgi:SAM-dependent methyltransferase